MRAALTRYAQPQPQRASDVIEVVRRIESALAPHQKSLERDGAAAAGASDPFVVDVLGVAAELDRLGDLLASWAVDRVPARPDAEVDSVVADVAARLDALGVAREESGPPAAMRARGRRRGV